MRRTSNRRRAGSAGNAGRGQSGAAPPAAFRVSAEPWSYHTEAQVHRALTADPRAYLRFLKSTLTAIATGRARLNLPPKQLFPDPATNGDFRVMPCELSHQGTTTKTVKLIGTNTVQRKVPDQITVGKLFVLHPEENYVAAAFEACLLSSARTGACAALAIAALADAPGQLVVIGSGRVGLYSAFYAAAARGVRRVIFCDPVDGRAQQAARWLAAAHPGLRCEARPVSGIDAADTVILATTSAAPLASPPCWGARLVVSLGADSDTQSELDPAWCRYADIYCDTLDSLRFGDLCRWTADGFLDAMAVSDLLEVFRHPPPPSGRPRVFISTGSGLFDNLTARYLLARMANPARSA